MRRPILPGEGARGLGRCEIQEHQGREEDLPHKPKPSHIILGPAGCFQDTLESFAGERIAATVVVDDSDPTVRVVVDAAAGLGFTFQRESVSLECPEDSANGRVPEDVNELSRWVPSYGYGNHGDISGMDTSF